MRALIAAFASAMLGLSCAPPDCVAPGARAASGCADCDADHVLLLGACVSPAIADAYCGEGARFVRDRCEAVLARRADVERAAAGHDDEDDARVALDDQHASCPRGTRLRGGDSKTICIARTRCRAGEIADGSRCAVLYREPGVVDIGAFLRGAIGVDGGEGTDDVCAPLLGDARGLPSRVALHFALRFPANQIADLNVRVLVSDATSDERIASAREASIESSVLPLFDVLRALGGGGARASTAAADVTVTCAMPMHATPTGVKSPHP